LADLVAQIRPFISQMQGSINVAHDSAQQALTKLGSDISGCNTAKATGDAEASSLDTTRQSHSNDHKSCRTRQKTANDDLASCQVTLTALEEAKKSSCQLYEDAKKTPGCGGIPATAGETWESYVSRAATWFVQERDTFMNKKDVCNNDTAKVDDQRTLCSGASATLKKVFDDTKQECHDKQTKLESATCSYVSKVNSTCNSFATCANTYADSFDTQKSSVETLENQRKVEWNATERLLCLLDVYGSSGDVDATKLQTCQHIADNTSHLNLVYPTIPRPSPCAAISPHPCDADYIQAEYGSLDAPAGNCTPCAWKAPTPTVPTEWNPPTNLIFKSQSNAHMHMMNADFPLAGTNWCNHLGGQKEGTPCYTPKDYNIADPEWYDQAVGFYFVLIDQQPRTFVGIDVVPASAWMRPIKLRAGCMADGRSSLASSASGTGFFMHDAPFQNVAPNLQTERIYATLNGTQFMPVLWACCASNTPPCANHPDTYNSCKGMDKHAMIFDTPITCNVGEKFFVMSGPVCDFRNGAMCYHKGWGITQQLFYPVPLVAR